MGHVEPAEKLIFTPETCVRTPMRQNVLPGTMGTADATKDTGQNAGQKPGFFSNKWFVLGVFCLVQISTTTDNTALSNAISAIVTTFHTSVAALQVANAIYPLVAGATMIVFGMLGMLWGWKRLLQLGLLVLVGGEVLAAISPNVVVFTYVARVLAGLGASMAIPAVIALTASLYKGKDLALAYGALGASSGVAAALGPIGSGVVIVALGWRWAFVMLAVLFGLAFIGSLGLKAKHVKQPNLTFDGLGALLASVSLVALIFGLLQISSWGFIEPVHAPFTIIGVSPCAFLVLGSLILFWLFLRWEAFHEGRGKSVLMPQVFIHTPVVRQSLYMNAVVFFVMGSFSFVVITFLQIVVGFDAIKSGAVFAVYAVGMVVFSIGTPMMFKRTSPRRLCQAGILILGFSSAWLAFGVERSATNPALLVGLFLSGVGCGLLASQFSTMIAGAIPQSLAEQSGGVQGTARNVGQALGIAIAGAILIGGLTSSVKDQTKLNHAIGAQVKDKVALVKEYAFVSNEAAEQYLQKYKVPPKDVAQLIDINDRARLRAARLSMLGMGALCLLFLLGTAKLPHGPKREDEAEA